MLQVNFLTKLVALRPGKTVREMLKNVMQGKDEGADDPAGNEEIGTEGRVSNGIAGKVRLFQISNSLKEILKNYA